MPIDQALVAFATEHNRRASFDARISELERICRRKLPAPKKIIIPTSRPQTLSGTRRLKVESRKWYAKEIIDTIGLVRHWIAHGYPDTAASEALVVGMLAARAGARHHWPEVQKWNAHVAHARRGSKAAAQERHDTAAEKSKQLRLDVSTLRRQHPEWSVNRIAQGLLRVHGLQNSHDDDGEREKAIATLGPADRKSAVAALAKRITRL